MPTTWANYVGPLPTSREPREAIGWRFGLYGNGVDWGRAYHGGDPSDRA